MSDLAGVPAESVPGAQESVVAAQERQFLVVAHTGRDIVRETMAVIAKRCADAGIGLRVIDHDIMATPPGPPYVGDVYPIDLEELRDTGADVAVTSAGEQSAVGCEVVIVLGGDGTFLRAAEIAHPLSVPVLGINLGHIGFLAEAEANRIDEVMTKLVTRDYSIEDRMTLDISIRVEGRVIAQTWALNEVEHPEPVAAGCPGADHRGRRTSGLGIRCRRHPGLHTDRFDRLRVLRGRPGHVA